jgi:hypothetical protein
MQKLPDFIPTFSHHLKPLTRDDSQFTCMLFHPPIDGGIPLDSAVESQQFRSHRRSTFRFQYLWLGCTKSRHDRIFLSKRRLLGFSMSRRRNRMPTLSDPCTTVVR